MIDEAIQQREREDLIARLRSKGVIDHCNEDQCVHITKKLLLSLEKFDGTHRRAVHRKFKKSVNKINHKIIIDFSVK